LRSAGEWLSSDRPDSLDFYFTKQISLFKTLMFVEMFSSFMSTNCLLFLIDNYQMIIVRLLKNQVKSGEYWSTNYLCEDPDMVYVDSTRIRTNMFLIGLCINCDRWILNNRWNNNKKEIITNGIWKTKYGWNRCFFIIWHKSHFWAILQFCCFLRVKHSGSVDYNEDDVKNNDDLKEMIRKLDRKYLCMKQPKISE